MTDTIVIDAENGIMGRIAAFAAKQALQGKKIAIVNCENVIISGTKDSIMKNYLQKFALGKRRQVGPYFVKTVEGIMKRTIRGMLPHKQARGKNALKNIKCYKQVPQEFQSAKKIEMKSDVKTFMTLKRVLELTA